MSFLDPRAAALLGLLPLLVLFYFLRLRRPPRRVGSLLLFRAASLTRRVDRPFRRLERSLLLLLQLLVLAALVLALMQPFRARPETPGSAAVLIIDTSASMGTREAAAPAPAAATPPAAAARGATRLEQATAAAARTVRALGPSGRAAIISTDARPRVILPLTGSRPALREALERLRPADTGGRLDEALALARGMLRGQANGSIHLYTDGVVPALETAAGGGPRLEVVPVGRETENVGIVTLGARRRDPAGGDFELFVAVESTGTSPRQGDLVILRDGSPIATRRLALPAPGHPGGSRQAFSVPVGSGPARLQARLDLDRPDALTVDDTATLVLPPPRPLRVAVVTASGAEEPYLLRALGADPWLQVQPEPDTADVVIWLGRVPPAGQEPGATRPALILPGRQRAGAAAISPPPAAFGTPVGPVAHPRTATWQRQHPVLRHGDLTPVRVSAALGLRPAGTTDVLWDSTGGPLLLAREERGRRSLWLAFHPLDSDLPLRVAYPVLVLSAVRWLGKDEGALVAQAHRTGQPATVPVPAGTVALEQTLPDGTVRRWPVPFGSAQVGLGVLDRAGFHRLRALRAAGTPDDERWLAASLLDRAESRIAPAPLRFAPEPPGAAALAPRATPAATTRGGLPFWRWAAALALGLLLLEWLAYRRGWVRA